VEWQIGRWFLSVGTKNYDNAVTLGGTMGLLHIHFGHFQFLVMWNGGKLRWPRFYDWCIFRHVLGPENKRWTDHAMGVQFWPVAVGIYWHTTCYECVAEYSRDMDAHYSRLQAKPNTSKKEVE